MLFLFIFSWSIVHFCPVHLQKNFLHKIKFPSDTKLLRSNQSKHKYWWKEKERPANFEMAFYKPRMLNAFNSTYVKNNEIPVSSRDEGFNWQNENFRLFNVQMNSNPSFSCIIHAKKKLHIQDKCRTLSLRSNSPKYDTFNLLHFWFCSFFEKNCWCKMSHSK